MKIYTSYHAQKAKVERMGIVPVNISQSPPRWEKYEKHYYLFAPTPDIRKMEEEEYELAFATHLETLRPEKVLESLKNLSDGKNIALMCYEKIGEFCHRHLVAEWITKNLGIQVLELDTKDKDLFS